VTWTAEFGGYFVHFKGKEKKKSAHGSRLKRLGNQPEKTEGIQGTRTHTQSKTLNAVKQASTIKGEWKTTCGGGGVCGEKYSEEGGEGPCSGADYSCHAF